MAADLSESTRCEVNFLAGDQLCGSSFTQGPQKALPASLSSSHSSLPLVQHPPALYQVDGNSYVGGAYPILPTTTDATDRLVLLEDWSPTQAFLDRVQYTLLCVVLVLFLYALAAGISFPSCDPSLRSRPPPRRL